MLFSQDRAAIRRYFTDAWQRHQAGQVLEPLQTLIVGVIEQHPEYHALLSDPDRAASADFPAHAGQANPFMHMGMHIALQEQLSVDRPAGIRAVYQTLCQRQDIHDVEHRMLETLGEILWEAGRDGRPPDETVYLERLRGLL